MSIEMSIDDLVAYKQKLEAQINELKKQIKKTEKEINSIKECIGNEKMNGVGYCIVFESVYENGKKSHQYASEEFVNQELELERVGRKITKSQFDRKENECKFYSNPDGAYIFDDFKSAEFFVRNNFLVTFSTINETVSIYDIDKKESVCLINNDDLAFICGLSNMRKNPQMQRMNYERMKRRLIL